MTLIEGLVIVAGLGIGYWLVSTFTRAPSPIDEPRDEPRDERHDDERHHDERPGDAAANSGDTPWHDVLGVSERATDAEITAAYRSKMAQYHPDKVATMGPEIRAVAELMTAQVNRAYEDALRRSR